MEFYSIIDKIGNLEDAKPLMNKMSILLNKTSTKEFFNSYRNRTKIWLISEYLTNDEKLDLVFINKFTFIHMQRLFFKDSFYKIKQNLYNKCKNLQDISEILKEHDFICKRLGMQEMKTRRGNFATHWLVSHWINKLFLQKKIDFEGKKITILDLNDLKIHGYTVLVIISMILGMNQNLKTIYLSNNNMSFNIHRLLLKSLTKEKPWEELYLNNNNNMFSKKESMKYFINYFPKIPHLKILNLSATNLNERASEILSEHINTLESLTHILFDNNPIGIGLNCILKSLKNLQKLKNLSLKNTIDRQEIGDSMSEFLLNCNLENLILNENKFPETFFSEIKYPLSVCRVKNINFYNCCLTDIFGKLIFQGIKDNESIIELVLSHNYFTSNISFSLSKLLENNKTIKKIHFANNTLPENVSAITIKSENIVELMGLVKTEKSKSKSFIDEIKLIRVKYTHVKIST
jgi:hypothetical protein